MPWCNRPAWPHRWLSLAEIRFRGFGCGKFPVSVGLGARGTRVQLARFLGRCATSRTRHGKYLFQREFLGFHHLMMPIFGSLKMLNSAHFQQIRRAVSFIGASTVFYQF
jgi:hypothetical protein